jgi:hypothetical protein
MMRRLDVNLFHLLKPAFVQLPVMAGFFLAFRALA